MNKNARQARRTVRERAAATRQARSLHRGRALVTHALAAGMDAETAKGVANGLRSVAKRLGVEPVKVTRTHRNADRTRTVHHYTAAQVARLRAAYRPRKEAYREALAAWSLAA